MLGSLAACAALVAPASGAETTTSPSCPTPSGRTVVRTLPSPGQPHQVLARGDTLWVTLQRAGGRARVIRLDARTGRVDRSFPLEGVPDRLVYGFGSLWIPEEIRGKPGGTLIRLDPRSGRVLAEIRAPAPRLFGATLTVTPAAVWIGGADTRLDTSSIFLVDPRKNAVVRSGGAGEVLPGRSATISSSAGALHDRLGHHREAGRLLVSRAHAHHLPAAS
jgi:hypothetical protein